MNYKLSMTTIALCAAFAGGAQAQCLGSKSSTTTSAMLRMRGPLASLRQSTSASSDPVPSDTALAASAPVSIVGLWDLHIFFQGMEVDEAWDVFNADGNELLNDAAPAAVGNFCVGVWTQTGPLTVSLHHVSWIFDDSGNLSGRQTIDEKITLDPSGQSFTGTADGVNYDLDGNKITTGPLAPSSVTLQATRIAAPAATAANTASTKAVANPKNSTATLRQIVLDGSASTSADGKSLSYFWTLAQGSLPAAISQGATAKPVVTFGAGDGPYTFVLTVTDSAGGTATDTVTVNFAGV